VRERSGKRERSVAARSTAAGLLDRSTASREWSPRACRRTRTSVSGVEGDALLLALGDVAISTGAACASGTAEPSYVLKAIGLEDDLALASLRFGLGRFTTDEEIDFAIDRVAATVTHLRG
jgi:cysteine desulfurase